MKIAIAPFHTPFLDLFVNLSLYLEKLGHEVFFLSPDSYIEGILKNLNLKVVIYPSYSETINYFDNNHDLIRFCKRLYSIKRTGLLIKRKNQEYSKAFYYFQTNKGVFDKVVFWNGAENVEAIVCEGLGISCMYIENGYFPNTMQINYSGVNCKADYARLSCADFLGYKYPQADIEPIEFAIIKVKQGVVLRYLKRFLDPKFNYLTINILKTNNKRDKATKRFSHLEQDTFDLDKLGDFIFFPLQVNSDTQIVLNSPYKSVYDVLENIIDDLKSTGYKIVLKEHPSEVEIVNYEKFVDNKVVFLIRKYSLDELISKAKFVVNVNSSVGLQAVEAIKKVLVLGNSLYGNAPNAVIYKKGQNLLDAINSISINKSEVDNYINHFKQNIFIKGNFKNPDSNLLFKMIKRIIAKKI